MVSYYNPLPYSQKHSATNLAYTTGQPWQWHGNYHTPPNHQFLGDIDSPHSHQMYYNPHHVFHPAAASATSEWHSPTSVDNFSQNAANAHMLQQQHTIASGGGGGVGIANGSGSNSSGSNSVSAVSASGNTTINETGNNIGEPHIGETLPSPPITVSSSEISSPGAPTTSVSPHVTPHHGQLNNSSPSTNNNNNSNAATHNRTPPAKPQYFEWMKKPSYPAQPTPGKTRTKDKYRVVYTDYQRLELEKEYCTSRYITIRRKTELAQSLSLSERQVKIWFQNRRAKERKQNKKGSDPQVMNGMQHAEYANLMETKPKLEPGLHLQHSLHSMSSMAAMSMSPMTLHHLHHGHHSLAVSAVAAHSHQLHQSPHAAANVGIGALSM